MTTITCLQEIMLAFIAPKYIFIITKNMVPTRRRHCSYCTSYDDSRPHVFGERIISRDLWPPRSPDLTPPDLYLWGKLKGLVYADNPCSINDFKHNIRQVIADIRCKELHQVLSSLRRRVELCLQEDGSHFQQLL